MMNQRLIRAALAALALSIIGAETLRAAAPTKTPPKFVSVQKPSAAAAKTAVQPKTAVQIKNASLKPATLPALPEPERLEVFPDAVKLDSRRAYRQLVISGTFGGATRDVTQAARYVVDEKVARVVKGRVEAVGDGNSEIVVTVGKKSLRVPVAVRNFAAPQPVSFKFETVAALTKQGCSAGSCHGSPHGKGGFSLSLFGYDPRIDKVSLVRDGFNRRLDVMEPTQSLLLKKPLLEISHGGGKKLRKTETGYKVLRDWIYEGANIDLPDVEVVGIKVTPNTARVLKAPFLTQQLGVTATFSDGTTRDVSAIATYESSHPAVASVDMDGLVMGRSRGQAAVSVRYLNALESVYVTVIEDVKGFQWGSAPEANFVDRLVNEKLKQLQYLPSGDCRDDEFLRRASLDLTGLIPPSEKVRAFLADKAADKRAKLIDELLGSEEYARFAALKKADLMRLSPRYLKNGRAELFSRWMVDEMRENTGHDKFARAILTASGDTQKIAPANYYLAITDEKERAEMTSQIFMGSRIECAKCHNHPFENWTMRDYYSISAVFARTRADKGEIKLASGGETSLPNSGERMKPWGMTDEKTQAKLDRRALFADWLTKPDNPLFARVEVNRIWADLMGRGIVDPVDDFRSSNPPSNVPLLDALAQEFVKSGYDRKHIIRLICNSKTYQRTTQTNKFNESDEMLFSHAKVRLLTAEQLRDAIKMATRALPTADTIAPRLAELQGKSAKRTAELDQKYEAWQTQSAADIAQWPVRFGGWSMAGPLPHRDFDKALKEALAPEKFPIDLTARFDGGAWQLRPDLKDNERNLLTDENNFVHYVYRRILSDKAQNVDVNIELFERGQVWLNGALLLDKPFNGNRKLSLKLNGGENALLIKLVNGGGDAGFVFRYDNESVRKLNLPPHAVEILATPDAARTGEQKRLLHEAYLESDGNLRGLKSQIARLEDRLDYATQRPYPEDSSFAVAFGQPKRESACTCERQSSPTLLQALELLNGDIAFRSASDGAARYADFDNDKLIEELYLSSVARFPTAAERAAAQKFLAGGERKTAVADLVWTLTNTREFLFQH